MSAGETPLVSILIPAYNAERWIAETLCSALSQTWPAKEVIVVDDGSKDNTLAIARRFESQGVRVVSQRNRGAAAARNHAFALSKGQYIQWLDADDLLAPDKISLQMEARGSDDLLLSGEWGQFLLKPSKAIFTPSELWQSASPVDWLTAKLRGNLHMQTATWLVSRRLTEAAGPWDTALTGDDDGEYFCRVLRVSAGIRFVPGAKVYYRLAGGSSLSYLGTSRKKLHDQWVSMQRHIRHLLSMEDSPRTRNACLAYLKTWFIYFYPEEQEIVRDARRMAAELGGTLTAPRLPGKYAWLKTLFGWKVAKRVQLQARSIRWSIQRSLERGGQLFTRHNEVVF
jgi:glycosyltransferase involved in cell wall biosynthesis